IRGRASNEEGKVVHIKPGNPENGKTVFEAKKCTVCHSQGSRGLGQAPLQRSLTEIVGLMWSHSFQMVSDMRRVGLKIPRFSEQEMADLVSYLYFLPYYGEKGDPSKGKDVFSEKGCAVCHSRDAVEEGKGIDLAETAGFSLFELVSAMWNHVPEMEKMVTELNLAWPRFEKDEMKDLIAYIQSLE
ncbi:MAG: c-type cytochrome, partial [Candidatus Aminicenantales bacterium]